MRALLLALLLQSPVWAAQTAPKLAPAAVRAEAVRQANAYAAQLPAARAQIEGALGGLGEITARAKSADSLEAKLARGKDVRDGLGARLTLEDATPEGMKALTDRLVAVLRDGGARALSISNISAADDGMPYLDDLQSRRLERAARRGNPAVFVKPPADSRNPVGYTALHMNLELAGGEKVELQVRGREVHAVAEAEHGFYDARRRKSADGTAAEAAALRPHQRAIFESYLRSQYRRARLVESGQEGGGLAPIPELPASLPASLALQPLGALR